MNLHEFVKECNMQDMYVILRIGPWVHAELKYGGFPKFEQKYKKKRTNDPTYLDWVKNLFSKYYEQVKEFMYPNGNLIAIQLENEFWGKFNHIKTLKDIAIEVGFKLPIYIATAWPIKVDENEVLPMYGGYPEAPWEQHTRALKSDDRFSIVPVGISNNIGSDLLKMYGNPDYTKTPIAYCELGAGNQVTNHRRPIISTKDAYNMAFVTIAKGCNVLGYYVYHGGRNPNFARLQESRKTGYPNNMPMISYDFEAPISEYGYPREKYFYNRLLHYMCIYFDEEFCLKKPVFPSTRTDQNSSYNIRINGDSGYAFMTTYSRLNNDDKLYSFPIEIKTKNEVIKLPTISLKSNESFCFPFNLRVESIKIDYILAQPFLKYEDKEGVHLMFFKHPNIEPKMKLNGEEITLEVKNSVSHKIEDKKPILIEIYTPNYASKILFDKKPIFDKNYIYNYDDKLVEIVENPISNNGVSLNEVDLRKMPYDDTFYGKCNPSMYELTVDKKLLAVHDDIKITFKSNTDKAHIYVYDSIVGDYFLSDGDFTICLDRYRQYINKDKTLTIKTSAVKGGIIKKVYYEIETVKKDSKITGFSMVSVDKIIKNI